MTLCIVLRLIGTLFYPGFGLSARMMIGILLMLLALGFVKDLGEQKSRIIFWVLIILEAVLAVVRFDKNEAMSSIAGSLSRLVLDASRPFPSRQVRGQGGARHPVSPAF